MTNISFTIYAILAILIVAGKFVSSMNCGCTASECCSRWGICGIGDDYCGRGCRSGLCYSSSSTNNGVQVSDVVTDSFFNGIINETARDCSGRGFYTRRAFLKAVTSFPGFGTEGSADVAKREIAAFLAHVAHETGNMCNREEIDGESQNYCKPAHGWPCIPGRQYYGRGPLQLKWNYNYGLAGSALGFNGLDEPQVVATDPILSFKTALWFWIRNYHVAIISGQGFRLGCNGTEADLVKYYRNYCNQFGVDPGYNNPVC